MKFTTTFASWQKKIGMDEGGQSWYWGGEVKKSSPNIVDDSNSYTKLLTKARRDKEVHFALGDEHDYESTG